MFNFYKKEEPIRGLVGVNGGVGRSFAAICPVPNTLGTRSGVWNTPSGVPGRRMYGVTYSPTQDLWITALRNPPSPGYNLYKSTDNGSTWNEQSGALTSMGSTPNFGNIIWDDYYSKFYITLADGNIAHSSDGSNWTLVTISNISYYGSTYKPENIVSNNEGFLIRSGGNQDHPNDAGMAHYSTDGGSTWTEISGSSSSDTLQFGKAMGYANGTYICGSDSAFSSSHPGAKILRSTDGINWTQQTAPSSNLSPPYINNYNGVATDGCGNWVMTGWAHWDGDYQANAGSVIYSDDDGISWHECEDNNGNTFNNSNWPYLRPRKCAYGNGVFVFVSDRVVGQDTAGYWYSHDYGKTFTRSLNLVHGSGVIYDGPANNKKWITVGHSVIRWSYEADGVSRP